MKKKAIKLLKELSEAHAAPGAEQDVRNIFKRELKTPISYDRSGSIIHEIKSAKGPRVMITGHMDEVGFAVQAIKSNGFIAFTPTGGWWEHTLLAQRVSILNSDGKKITGVISSIPPHFLSADQRKKIMPMDKMFIDIGASSRKEVTNDFNIQLGDSIVPESLFSNFNHPDLYIGKAFDNRVGIAATIQAAQALAKIKTNNSILAVGTVQEEVGCRGATTAANLLKPDVAIILEGPPADDTPGFDADIAQGKLGSGVQIRLMDPTAIMNKTFRDLVISTAEKAKIPYQVAVRRSGGTDAKSIHLSNNGVASIVLGVPARYIHTHNSIININDYISCLKLTIELAKCLNTKTVNTLYNYE
ncbi:MAG: M42 family metallopeptidase [Lentisphaeria bacterium]|nr:M42 family metallopeptidase [Lentisphaeria bacterium]NQZ70743.1 M42 family metallopeptidase [Lentisphaeria bacterium]